MSFRYTPQALDREIMTRALKPVAERIAERTKDRAVMSEYRFGVKVRRPGLRRFTVSVDNPLAAVEEFGSIQLPTGRSGAPMRSAAAEERGYRPL